MDELKTKAAYLEVDARPRYWEDCRVNDVEDTEGALIPFRYGDSWKPVIRLADGFVLDWPQGMTAEVHYKVCDDGDYRLCDTNMVPLAKWGSFYVADAFLCPGGGGYGDYIILTISADGFIQGWRHPEINPEEWEALP